MYVLEELQLNVYRDVEIPDGRELFRRGILGVGTSYCPDQVAPMPMTKIDAISKGDHLNNSYVRDEIAAAARAAAAAEAAAAAAAGKSVEPANPAEPAPAAE